MEGYKQQTGVSLLGASLSLLKGMSMDSIQGHTITVIKWGNKDPDKPFMNYHAEIEIDGDLKLGDIVFTDTIRAYYESQYHLTSRLNRCVLHVALEDEFSNLRIRLQNGRAIPTVIMDTQERGI